MIAVSRFAMSITDDASSISHYQQTLFQQLGQSWYAQLKPASGECYCLDSDVEVGKAQFEFVRLQLTHDLARRTQTDVIDCVAGTISRDCDWQMPPDVTAALAISLGLTDPQGRIA
jgi:phosphoribosyl-dephospho-CoA transferase